MRLSVGEAAKKLGVSIRTLRYYDEIGLARPAYTNSAGYRYYDEASMRVLTQVLFLRELDMPVKEIERIVKHPDYDGARALQMHKNLMQMKKQRIEEIIALIDEMEENHTMNGKTKMTQAQIDAQKAEYAREARERWGNTEAYAQSASRHGKYTPEQEAQIERESEAIFAEFAGAMPLGANSPEAQALVEKWRAHISKWHYDCQKPMLSCLGAMYVSDERFAENLNRRADGLAQFMSDAIAEYCK